MLNKFFVSNRRDFSSLSEQEVLALAISSEEDDARIYLAYADGLREDYPQSAKIFEDMAAEEGEHRTRLCYRMKSLLDAGMEVPASTDAPVVDYPPLANIHDMVNRSTSSGAPFVPEERVTVAEAVHVARSAALRIRENFALSILYNIVAVPFAVAGLATPLIAALAMSLSSISVTLNALRLR